MADETTLMAMELALKAPWPGGSPTDEQVVQRAGAIAAFLRSPDGSDQQPVPPSAGLHAAHIVLTFYDLPEATPPKFIVAELQEPSGAQIQKYGLTEESGKLLYDLLAALRTGHRDAVVTVLQGISSAPSIHIAGSEFRSGAGHLPLEEGAKGDWREITVAQSDRAVAVQITIARPLPGQLETPLGLGALLSLPPPSSLLEQLHAHLRETVAQMFSRHDQGKPPPHG